MPILRRSPGLLSQNLALTRPQGLEGMLRSRARWALHPGCMSESSPELLKQGVVLVNHCACRCLLFALRCRMAAGKAPLSQERRPRPRALCIYFINVYRILLRAHCPQSPSEWSTSTCFSTFSISSRKYTESREKHLQGDLVVCATQTASHELEERRPSSLLARCHAARK